MYIIDIPLHVFPAPKFDRLQPKNLPALPHGELESLLKPPLPGITSPSADVGPLTFLETGNPKLETVCQYLTSTQRPCPRPVVHYADNDQPEEYCAAHLAWIEQVEDKFDVPYPDSPQALLDLLAHTTAQVLAGQMIGARALQIIQLVRAMERQLRWM